MGGLLSDTYKEGVEVDFVAYENFVPGWNITAKTGESIQRISPEDTDSVSDWMVYTPTPGYPWWIAIILIAAGLLAIGYKIKKGRKKK
jgi:hypothetical protein